MMLAHVSGIGWVYFRGAPHVTMYRTNSGLRQRIHVTHVLFITVKANQSDMNRAMVEDPLTDFEEVVSWH